MNGKTTAASEDPSPPDAGIRVIEKSSVIFRKVCKDTDKLVLDGSKFWVSRTKIGEEKMGVRIEMARSEGSGSGNWRRREVSD